MRRLLLGLLLATTMAAGADPWGMRAGGAAGNVNARPRQAQIPAIPAIPEGIETRAQAAQWISSIHHEDPTTQNAMRAEAARQVVSTRVDVVNDVSGYAWQVNPLQPLKFWGDGLHPDAPIPTRTYGDRAAAVMDYSRGTIKPKTPEQQANLDYWRSIGPEQAAWDLGLGACTEHAHLVAEILREAGVEVQVFNSTNGHVFPVVNLPPGADPDMPWTWGDAYIPDSWMGQGMTPEQAWYNHWIFGRGSGYVGAGSANTSRERLLALARSLRNDDPELIEEWRELWERLPPSIRDRYPEPPQANSRIQRGTMGGQGGGQNGFTGSGPRNTGNIGGGPTGGHTHQGGRDVPTGGGCSGY